MPRVCLTEKQRRAEVIRRNLRALQGKRTAEEMANMIGAKSATTWRARLNAPLTLTILELMQLSENYHVNAADIVSRELIG